MQRKGPTMNAINIDREAVKTLAIAVGVREAARQLGLNENSRPSMVLNAGNGSNLNHNPLKQGDVITVIKPSEALAENPKAAQ